MRAQRIARLLYWYTDCICTVYAIHAQPRTRLDNNLVSVYLSRDEGTARPDKVYASDPSPGAHFTTSSAVSDSLALGADSGGRVRYPSSSPHTFETQAARGVLPHANLGAPNRRISGGTDSYSDIGYDRCAH